MIQDIHNNCYIPEVPLCLKTATTSRKTSATSKISSKIGYQHRTMQLPY